MKDYDIAYCGSNCRIDRLVHSIESLLRNIRVKNNINFHILDFNISQENKDKIYAIVNKYKVLNADDSGGGGGVASLLAPHKSPKNIMHSKIALRPKIVLHPK